MLINSEKIVSISEVNQKFSHVMKLLDKHKTLTIMRNNKPTYMLIDYKILEEDPLLKKHIESIN